MLQSCGRLPRDTCGELVILSLLEKKRSHILYQEKKRYGFTRGSRHCAHGLVKTTAHFVSWQELMTPKRLQLAPMILRRSSTGAGLLLNFPVSCACVLSYVSSQYEYRYYSAGSYNYVQFNMRLPCDRCRRWTRISRSWRGCSA